MPPFEPGPTRIVRFGPPVPLTTRTTTRPPVWYETAHWPPSLSVTVGFSPGPTTDLRPLRRTITFLPCTHVTALPSREKFGSRPIPNWRAPPERTPWTRIRPPDRYATLLQWPSIEGSLAADVIPRETRIVLRVRRSRTKMSDLPRSRSAAARFVAT